MISVSLEHPREIIYPPCWRISLPISYSPNADTATPAKISSQAWSSIVDDDYNVGLLSEFLCSLGLSKRPRIRVRIVD